jgi:DNA primase
MRSVEIPADGRVKSVYFAIDGDSASLKAAKAGAGRLCGDYDTRVMRSPRGMDWNDVLKQTAG